MLIDIRWLYQHSLGSEADSGSHAQETLRKFISVLAEVCHWFVWRVSYFVTSQPIFPSPILILFSYVILHHPSAIFFPGFRSHLSSVLFTPISFCFVLSKSDIYLRICGFKLGCYFGYFSSFLLSAKNTAFRKRYVTVVEERHSVSETLRILTNKKD